MKDVGITGKAFNIIKIIYSSDQACLKKDGKIVGPFKISQRVRQGCVLSPLLFHIFMAGLAKKLHSKDLGLKLESKKMNTI